MKDPNEAMLLTDDGHPIGELVIADNTSVPPVDVPTPDERKSEDLRMIASELTGNPDADASIAELYPGYSDGEKKHLAMTMFISGSGGIADIAKSVSVPERTVSMWMYEGGWDRIVKKEIAARQSASLVEMARIRADRRARIARQQLEQAERIREKAAADIESGDVSLKSGAEAWAAAAKIEHTLTGVSEAGAIADVEGKQEDGDKQSGKTPLVVVFNGLPPVRKAGQ